jgi:hypothetical protein
VTLGNGVSTVMPRATVADSNGGFSFVDLAAGEFTLAAKLDGYVGGRFGQRYSDDSDLVVELGLSEHRATIVLPLWKLATVSGQVTVGAAKPIPRARVLALRQSLSRGRHEYRRRQAATADETGSYRLAVPPGNYLIAVESFQAPTGSGRLSYPTMFYPSTGLASHASVLELRGGEDIGGVDLSVSAIKPLRVTGGLQWPDSDSSLGRVQVSLVGESDIPTPDLVAASTTLDSNRSFAFPTVFPGRYRLRAIKLAVSDGQLTARLAPSGGLSFSGNRAMTLGAIHPPTPDEPTWVAELPISVSEVDVRDLMLVLKPAARLSGRVQFSGGTPSLSQLQSSSVITIPIRDSDLSLPITRLESGGLFRTAGLPPGLYSIGLFLSFPGFTLKEATLAGRSTLDVPIEVGSDDPPNVSLVMTSLTTEISGVVRDSKGLPADGASIYVFPAERQHWTQVFHAFAVRWRAVRSSRQGGFSVRGLPPGDYVFAAVSGPVPELWYSERSLGALSTVGRKITVQEATKTQLSIDALPWPLR